MNLIRVDAGERFIKSGRCFGPEKKRKIIGEEFIQYLKRNRKIRPDGISLPGTIYPDWLRAGRWAAVIKSHHNVGGLPENSGFEGIIEPLRNLFKDEVRRVGLEIGIPESSSGVSPSPDQDSPYVLWAILRRTS